MVLENNVMSETDRKKEDYGFFFVASPFLVLDKKLKHKNKG